MQTYLWKLQVTTIQVSTARCLWLSSLCANVQVQSPGVKSVEGAMRRCGIICGALQAV